MEKSCQGALGLRSIEFQDPNNAPFRTKQPPWLKQPIYPFGDDPGCLK